MRYFSLIIFLTACGPAVEAPLIPEPTPKAPDGASSTADAQTAASAPSASKAASAPPSATEKTRDQDQRLADLPDSIQKNIRSCEGTQHFYDLSIQSCTKKEPAHFPCVIDAQFRSMLPPAALPAFDKYLMSQASGMTLYSCTMEGSGTALLHFYKMKGKDISYRKLLISLKGT